MTSPITNTPANTVTVTDADLVGLPVGTVLDALDHESDDGRTYFSYMEKDIVVSDEGIEVVARCSTSSASTQSR